MHKARRSSTPLRFAAALADGDDVFAFRWASDDKPPTLYLHREAYGVRWWPASRWTATPKAGCRWATAAVLRLLRRRAHDRAPAGTIS